MKTLMLNSTLIAIDKIMQDESYDYNTKEFIDGLIPLVMKAERKVLEDKTNGNIQYIVINEEDVEISPNNKTK